MQRTTTRRLMPAVLCLSALTLSAAAGTPQALDRVPGDSPIVFAMSSLDEFLDDMAVYNTVSVQPDPTIEVVSAMAREYEGLDTSGSAAMVLQLGGPTPDMVMVVTTTDFAAFSANSADAEGIATLDLGGQTVFTRDLGDGYAVLARDRGLVSDFNGVAGQLAAHEARMGAVGKSIADDASTLIVIDIPTFADQMKEGVLTMEEQAGMMAMMMGGGADISGALSTIVSAVTTLADQGQAAILGASIDEAGWTIDMGVQFREGTDAAGLFAETGDSSGLVSHIAPGDYFFAYASDLSMPGTQKIMSSLTQMMGDQMGASSVIAHVDGVAGAIGSSPAVMQTGVLSRSTTYYRSANAADVVGAFKTSVGDASEMEVPGINVTSSYTDGATTIADHTVDQYSMQFTPDQAGGGMGMGMDPSMMYVMMFGPSMGPNGYVAQVEGGVVQTTGSDTELAAAAIAAAEGGDSLASNEQVKATAAHLQSGRFSEVYFAADTVLNSVGPMAMMMGAMQNFEPMGPTPPIGLGLAAGDGGLHFRVFMPSEVAAQLSELMPAGEDNWDDSGDDGLDF